MCVAILMAKIREGVVREVDTSARTLTLISDVEGEMEYEYDRRALSLTDGGWEDLVGWPVDIVVSDDVVVSVAKDPTL